MLRACSCEPLCCPLDCPFLFFGLLVGFLDVSHFFYLSILYRIYSIYETMLKLTYLLLEFRSTALSTKVFFYPLVLFLMPFWVAFYVLTHVPTQLGCYNTWEKLPCCGEADNWPVVSWCHTLVVCPLLASLDGNQLLVLSWIHMLLPGTTQWVVMDHVRSWCCIENHSGDL